MSIIKHDSIDAKYIELFHNIAIDRGYTRYNDKDDGYYLEIKNKLYYTYITTVSVKIPKYIDKLSLAIFVIVDLSEIYSEIDIKRDESNEIINKITSIQRDILTESRTRNILNTVFHISFEILVYTGDAKISSEDNHEYIISNLRYNNSIERIGLNYVDNIEYSSLSLVQLYNKSSGSCINPIRNIMSPVILYAGSLLRWLKPGNLYTDNYIRMIRMQRRYNTNVTYMYKILINHFRTDFNSDDIIRPFNEEMDMVDSGLIFDKYSTKVDKNHRIDLRYFIEYITRYHNVGRINNSNVPDSVSLQNIIRELNTTSDNFPRNLSNYPLRHHTESNIMSKYLNLVWGDILFVEYITPVNNTGDYVWTIYVVDS